MLILAMSIDRCLAYLLLIPLGNSVPVTINLNSYRAIADPSRQPAVVLSVQRSTRHPLIHRAVI